MRHAELTNQSVNEMISNAPLTARRDESGFGASQALSGLQPRSPISSRALDSKGLGATGVLNKNAPKHVKFVNNANSTPAGEYAKVGARPPKFVDASSPIDRYYKLYVEAPAEEKVFRGPLYGEAYKQSTRLRHARGCVHYKSKASMSPGSPG